MKLINLLFASTLISFNLLAQEDCLDTHKQNYSGCERFENPIEFHVNEKVWILPHMPLTKFDQILINQENIKEAVNEETNEKIDEINNQKFEDPTNQETNKVIAQEIDQKILIVEETDYYLQKKKDLKQEKKLFNLNFYDDKIALCPKLQSTSPGTYIHKLKGLYYQDISGEFIPYSRETIEQGYCENSISNRRIISKLQKAVTKKMNTMKKNGIAGGSEYDQEISEYVMELDPLSVIYVDSDNENYVLKKKQKLKKNAKFKVTMNHHGSPGKSDFTSGTYSPSSLLYYQFSRFLRTRVGVPVSIYREINKDQHYNRVTLKGKKLSKEIAKTDPTARLLRNGWKWLEAAERDKRTYKKSHHIFSPDRPENIFGIILDDIGDRYPRKDNKGLNGKEPNSQSRYRATEPFQSLMGKNDWTKLKSSIEQLERLYHMQDLLEINILDYIFSQQDRVGNIDFMDFIYYALVKDGKVSIKRVEAEDWADFEENEISDLINAGYKITQLGELRRSFINDNDAGVRLGYTNHGKKSDHAGSARHFNHRLIARLVYLHSALKNPSSEQYVYLWQNFVETQLISQAQFEQIEKNLGLLLTEKHATATNLKTACLDEAKFDLEPEKYASLMALHPGREIKREEIEVKVDCEKLFDGKPESEYIIR